jgi:4-oxalocrotonate tautomerase
MPVIRVEMFAGRTVEQKRALVAAVTEAFVNTCGGVPESVWVVIEDVPKENWGFGGRLGIDPKPGT